jgi:hypothetical protein
MDSDSINLGSNPSPPAKLKARVAQLVGGLRLKIGTVWVRVPPRAPILNKLDNHSSRSLSLKVSRRMIMLTELEKAIYTKAISPYYPDRCLECPELAIDDYGATHYNKCVDCIHKDLALHAKGLIKARE